MPRALPMRVVHRTVPRGPLDPRRRAGLGVFTRRDLDVLPYPDYDPIPTFLSGRQQFPDPLPSGTNLFVPGFLSDEQQHNADMRALGIAPLAIAAAVKPLTSLIHISFGKAVNTEKSIAPQLATLANAGNITAAGIMLARSTIVTQGFQALYAPLVSQFKANRPDVYAAGVALTKNPGRVGRANLWQWDNVSDIVPFAKSNGLYLAQPYTGGAATPASATVPQPITALPGGAPMVSPSDYQPAPAGGGTTTVVSPDGTVTTRPAAPAQASMFGGVSLPMLMGIGLVAFLLNRK